MKKKKDEKYHSRVCQVEEVKGNSGDRWVFCSDAFCATVKFQDNIKHSSNATSHGWKKDTTNDRNICSGMCGCCIGADIVNMHQRITHFTQINTPARTSTFISGDQPRKLFCLQKSIGCCFLEGKYKHNKFLTGIMAEETLPETGEKLSTGKC